MNVVTTKPRRAERIVITARADIAPRKTWRKKQNLGQSSNNLPTVSLLLLIARIAAMKKVLSPISETRITDKDSTKPCRKPSRQKVFESTNIWLGAITSMLRHIEGWLLWNADVGHIGGIRNPRGVDIVVWFCTNATDLFRCNQIYERNWHFCNLYTT